MICYFAPATSIAWAFDLQIKAKFATGEKFKYHLKLIISRLFYNQNCNSPTKFCWPATKLINFSGGEILSRGLGGGGGAFPAGYVAAPTPVPPVTLMSYISTQFVTY